MTTNNPLARRMRLFIGSPPPHGTPMQFPFMGIKVQVQTFILLEHLFGRRHALLCLDNYLTRHNHDGHWRSAEKWVLAALYKPEPTPPTHVGK